MNTKNRLVLFLGGISTTVSGLIIYLVIDKNMQLKDILPSLITGFVTFAVLFYVYLKSRTEIFTYLKNRKKNRRSKKALLSLEQTIVQLKGIRQSYIDLKLGEELLLIADAQLFLLLQQYDIRIMMSHLFMAETEVQLNFSARLFALTVYEFNQTVPVLLGKIFRNKLEKLSNISLTELDSITSRIRDLKKKNKQLNEIRNIVIAHRDHNAIKQLELMEGMASMDYVRLATLVTDIATDLQFCLVGIAKTLAMEKERNQAL